METIFIKRYIKSEADLPKVEGFYYVHLLDPSAINNDAQFMNGLFVTSSPNYGFGHPESNIQWWVEHIEYWLEEKPLPADEECAHPYHSVIGGDGQPEKCLKCGEILNQ